MNKTFKIATKRITTIAATAALVSSTVFGANLAHYPTNFVDNSEFDGTVVIGSTADSAAATSIIADLTAELSGESEQVKITAKMISNNGGDIVSALNDKTTLNYGGSFDIENLDEDSTDLLANGDLDNDNYEQTLNFVGTDAVFDYKLFTEVDATDATDGLYFSNGAAFAQYDLTFTDSLGLQASSADNSDFVGETITIMGNEFTVLEISTSVLTLVGGANKVSLGEGETSTVSVDGVSYEVEVQSVTEDEVLLSINGESKSVDFDEVEEIAGVTIGITEIVDSSRDAVKGYATLVIGGQKIEFDGTNEIQLNDEDFTDIHKDYEISASWDGTNSAEVLSITYEIDNEILLEEGDSLSDVLFDAFTLSYDGVNSVDYSELKLTSTKDEIIFDGNLYNGNSIPSEFQISVDEDASILDTFFLGSDDERIIFSGSQIVGNATDSTVVSSLEEIYTGLTVSSDTTNVADELEFNLSNALLDMDGLLFFTLELDKEDMHLYQVSSTSDDSNPGDSEISFDDLIDSTDLNDRSADDLESDLESNTFTDNSIDSVTVDLSALSELTGETVGMSHNAQSVLYLENEMLLNFESAESGAFITLTYSSDADADDEAIFNETFTISFAQDTLDADTEAILMAVTSANNLDAEEFADDSDYDLIVDAFGTMVKYDTEDFNSVTFMVPDEEVFGTVSFNFGAAGSSVETYTVSADASAAKIAELESDGYTVTTEVLSTEAVTFDIVAPVMADEVSGMNDMIVVGGPAVNAVAVALLGEGVVGVSEGEAVVRYFSESNSVLVYGWDAAGTQAAANKLNAGGLTGEEVNVQ
jgi:hypothetical protein